MAYKILLYWHYDRKGRGYNQAMNHLFDKGISNMYERIYSLKLIRLPNAICDREDRLTPQFGHNKMCRKI